MTRTLEQPDRAAVARRVADRHSGIVGLGGWEDDGETDALLVVQDTCHLNRVTAEVRSLKYPSRASQPAHDIWIVLRAPSTSSSIRPALLVEPGPDASEYYYPYVVSWLCRFIFSRCPNDLRWERSMR